MNDEKWDAERLMLRDELAVEIGFGREFGGAYAGCEGRPLEVMVYGAGKGGREFLGSVAGMRGVEVVGFVDDDLGKVGTEVAGVRVVGSEGLRGFGGAVVIAAAGWEGIEGRLREIGVKRWVYAEDFVTHVMPMEGEERGMGADHFDVEALLGAWEKVEWLDGELADERSRQTLRRVLRYRLTRRVRWCEKAAYREYRHPLVRAEEGDVVIDGGGFDGDTAALFLETGAREVHVFEPAAGNMERLRGRAVREGWGGEVVAVAGGVGERDGEMGFVEDRESPVGSRVREDSQVRVKVYSIDSYCRERGVKVDLIKLDVEGCEGAALAGAGGVIERDGPKLQVCVYHKGADLWELAEQVKLLRPGYRLYLGHHAAAHWSDLVLYAR